MCDYSLHGIQNRLAVEGERLLVHRFRTGSIGLAAQADLPQNTPEQGFWRRCMVGRPQELECAVCIPPGARLLLRDIPERIQREIGVNAEEEVVFTQLT